MAKIRILPDHLANQIAAGEVIERPASVVKELIENSIDAHAGRIDIEIEGGGSRLIRVVDDGEGMDEDDVLLCLERHGTSKIREDRDLAAIATLGFRGEAIPSIGSVAQLTITSRTRDAELGTKAVVSYGKLTRIHETGAVFGTQFEVAHLFGNTPARRKFLRSARTEVAHIEEVVRNNALGSPQIAFFLRVDGRETLHLDASHSLEQRLARIMALPGPFLRIGDSGATRPEHRVFGFLAPPETLLPASTRLRLFVNGRAVRDRMMTHAVIEGLRGFLMKGRNPAGLVHLVLPPSDVDVNVHPAKSEVRFRSSRDIHLLISEAVAGAMLSHQKSMQGRIFGREQVHDATPVPPAYQGLPEDHPAAGVSPPEAPPYRPDPAHPWAEARRRPLPVPTRGVFPRNDQAAGLLTAAEPPPAPPESRPVAPRPEQTGLAGPGPGQHGLRIIGQFDDLYILCQNAEGLLVIDQHAAHERLLFEDLRRQYLREKIAGQSLLFPLTVELSLLQARLLEQHLPELERMGFSLSHFGGNSFVIAGVPALAGQSPPQELLLDMLEQFGSESGHNERENRLDRILATMACRAAVKAGAALSTREIESLLERMAKADLFSHCPHGRPVWKIIDRMEIRKWFHRP
jgi:DNA mismatch repair protein MutL